jgi:hypothetical protein
MPSEVCGGRNGQALAQLSSSRWAPVIDLSPAFTVCWRGEGHIVANFGV